MNDIDQMPTHDEILEDVQRVEVLEDSDALHAALMLWQDMTAFMNGRVSGGIVLMWRDRYLRPILRSLGASQVEDDDELGAGEWIPSIDDYFRPYLRWKGWSEERIDAWLAGVRQGGASSQVDEVTGAESSDGSATAGAS